MMNFLKTKQTQKGIKIKFKNKNYELKYPQQLWKSYPNKEILVNNYIPLVTLSLPLMADIKSIKYNLPKSIFQQKYKELFLKDLPSSTQDNKQDAIKLTKQFKKIKYTFQKHKRLKLKTKNSKNTNYKAILPLSFGKDSLLTLAVSREIGLNPATIYINDTISPKENKQKLKFGKKLNKEFRQKHYIIQNNIEKLIDFDTWNKPETNFNYTHMITGFCLIALPIAHRHNSEYIIIGNEQDMDFSFKTWQGLEAWPAYDQTSVWQQELNKMIKQLTNKRTEVISIIRPLTNIAIIKILHKRYPEIAKYQFSCDCLNTSYNRRWCNECNKCAKLSLFMKAFGINTKKLGLKNLFSKKHKHFYSLFKGREVDRYEQNIESREQQLLAFLLATRQKAKGYLINYFKKHYLKEALTKENELRKKYFRIWPSNIPKEIKSDVLSIYREEFRDLQ